MWNVRWIGLLVAAVCVYNLPRLLTGSIQFDAVEVHYSAQRYLSDELHAARLPFWTPYLFTGFPFLDDLQVGAWYPLHWPFLLAGIQPASINAELVLHDLVACVGTYALGLRLFGRSAPAVAAAMFYGLSGWFAAHSQHVGMYVTAGWLPWLLLFLHQLVQAEQRLTLARLAVAGLLGAAIALPGSFQIALYTFTGLCVWAALEAIAARSAASARRFAVGLGVMAVWGALFAAVMILPGLELVTQSVRAELSARAQPDLGYFHLVSLVTLVYPDYFGLLSGHYSGPGDSTQHYFYSGILLVPLVLLGFRQLRIARSAVFLGLPFLWYALGPAGGLFRIVARLPGFSSVELPMHGWFLPALGLALLGGAGFAAIESRLSPAWRVAVLAVVFVDVLTVNQLLNPLAYARASFDQQYGAPLSAFRAQLDVASPPVERLFGDPLAAVGYRNHALQSRVETTYGYNPLELSAYAHYVEAAGADRHLADELAASHILTSDLRIVRNPTALPLARSAGDESADVEVVTRGTDELSFHYISATPALVQVAIPYYPGWHASIGDTDLPLERIEGAFIGVSVPAGEGVVRLVYTPRWFWLGAAISALSLVAALAALLLRQKRPEIARPSP